MKMFAEYSEHARRATYNPYENTTFVDKESGAPVMTAATVILDINSGVWYSDTGW